MRLSVGQFHVESANADVLRILLLDETIAAARDGEVEQVEAAQEMKENLGYRQLGEDAEDEEYDGDDGLGGSQLRNVSFPILAHMVEDVKRAAIRMDYPLMEEYDFRGDTSIPNLNIDLKPLTRIRTYQEKSLSKMFGNGRARSGIIVLPCGAGKSLTGVTACQTIKKSCIILCINTASVRQWKSEFERWTTIKVPNSRATLDWTWTGRVSNGKTADRCFLCLIAVLCPCSSAVPGGRHPHVHARQQGAAASERQGGHRAHNVQHDLHTAASG